MPVKDAMQMALTAGLSGGKAHAAGWNRNNVYRRLCILKN